MMNPKTNAANYTKNTPDVLHGKRLDAALAVLFPEFSRARLQSFIADSRVFLNNEVVLNQRQKIATGDSVFLNVENLPTETIDAPENIPLNIVFEDDEILIINKPAGLTVHPGNGQKTGTLLNALLFYNDNLAKIPRAGIVHRLDKDTSGLMVVAKTLNAQNDLVKQLKAKTVKRHYWAIIHGQLPKNLKINAPIGRHPRIRTKMAVVENGKPAVTEIFILKKFAKTTLIECHLQTGRTHQIRVHLANAGFPLVGDPVYGKKNSAIVFPRQALHAKRLGLIHPKNKQELFWDSELSSDFANLLEAQNNL